MAITRQFLEEQIASLQQQVSVFTGAIQFAEMLLHQMESDGMPIQEFAEMVAGAGASATVEESQE